VRIVESIIIKSKESLWVDHFLEMVINNQEDISVIPRIHSRVLTHLAVEIFSSSHLVPDKGDNISD
jgi:hypothetical protein